MISFEVFILGISLSLQLLAAFLAVRLIRITGKRAAWIFISAAIFFMAVRRLIPFLHLLAGSAAYTLHIGNELIGLILSALMAAGVAFIAPLFLTVKRSEEALRESKEWFHTTLKSISDAVIVTDTKGYVTFLNDTAQGLTGLKEKNAVGKPLKKVFSIIDEKTGIKKEDPVERIMKTKKAFGIDDHTLLVSKNGIKFPIDDSASPIKNNRGEIVGVVLVFRDITERRRAQETIKLAHKELNQIFNTAADGMRVIDKDRNVIRVNERFCMLANMGKEEIIGRKCYEIFHGLFCHTSNCSMNRIVSGVEYLEYDVEKERWDGMKISCIMTATPLRTSDGELIGIVEDFKDISERKRTEKLLHRARMVIENSPTVLFRWRAEEGWPVEFVSKNVTQFGYNPEELLSAAIPYTSIIHPLDLDRVIKEIRECSEHGKTHFQQEYRLVTKKGEMRWVDVRIVSEYDPPGRIVYYQGIVIDITERKQAEEALKFKKEQERLSVILDGHPIPTFVINCDHRVILWNRACQLLTGVSKKNALEKPVNSGIFYQGQSRPVLADLVLDMNRELIVDLYGDKNLTKSSAIPDAFEAQDVLVIKEVPKNYYFLAARLHDPEGEVMGAIETIQDVTEREQLQKQFLHSQKMEAVGRLAGGVAHDFNNLLVVIKGYSEFLMRRLDPQAPMRREIEMIKQTGDRAASLTRQLLAFSRKQNLQPEVLDLNTLVVNMEKMMRRLIGEDVKLITDLEPKLEQIKADPGQIEQVIMNLVVNARDAMPKGGEVTITTENINPDRADGGAVSHTKSERFICLSVRDIGSGIDKKIIDRLFEPFFTTKGPAKGTGLGLSTVYGIVKQHGGYIDIHSEPGKGSTFHIYLPALSMEVKEYEKVEAVSFKEFQGEGEKILLVEDEEDVRIFTARMLSENGYQVIEAGCAEEAMNIFGKEENNFDLVFSDVVLPGKNGLELIDQLLIGNSRLRVLLTSGYSDERLQWPLIKERKFRFLKKPYDLHDLLKGVKEAIGKS